MTGRDTLLSAARSETVVQTRDLPISLTDSVLQNQRDTGRPPSRTRRSSTSSKTSSLSMSPPAGAAVGRRASTRRASDATRPDLNGSRARRSSDVSRRGSDVGRRGSDAGMRPVVRGEEPQALATRQRSGSEAARLSDHAEEEDDDDEFFDMEPEPSVAAPVKTRAPAARERDLPAVPAAERAEPAAARPARPATSSRAAKGAAAVAGGAAIGTAGGAAVGNPAPDAPKHDSQLLFHQAKDRADRISKLKTSDVMITTEELRDDIALARRAMHLFLNSRMHEAYELVTVHSEKRLYYAVAYALLSTIKAIMTFEHQDLATAISHCKDALSIASHLRKRSSVITSFGRFVRGAGPSVTWVATMTPVQQHAELVTAECTLLKAVLGIAHSGDLFGFLSEALHMRAAYGAYHSLLKFIEWEDQHGSGTSGATRSDNDFRSGVYLGSGCISLILGLLPSKVLKIMEVFGYEGNVDVGLQLMSKAGKWSSDPKVTEPGETIETEGVRRVLCDMTMLVYHLVVSTFVPVPGVDIPYAEKVLNYHLQRYPRGVFFLYFHGRLYSTQALSKHAIECFKDARDIQEEYVQLKHICYWDMSLCSMSLAEWRDTYDDFSVLAEENNWSKAVYNYGRAAALYQCGDAASREQAADIFARVPSVTQKIAGKSIPLEKFVARKARKMIEQGYLTLPAMEFAYMCHCYTTASHRSLTQVLLPMVDDTLAELGSGEASGNRLDDLCLAHFLRGVILRNIAYPEEHVRFDGKRRMSVKDAARESEKSLLYVANHGANLSYDHYLVYFSHYELGRLYIGERRYSEARSELELVLSNKNLGDHGRKGKYSMQNMAVLRSNGALELLDHAERM